MKPLIILMLFLVALPTYAFTLEDYDPELRPHNTDLVLGFTHFKDCNKEMQRYHDLYTDSVERRDKALNKLVSVEEDKKTLERARHEARMEKIKGEYEEEFEDCVERARIQNYEFKGEVLGESTEDLQVKIQQLLQLIELLKTLIALQ